MARLVRGANGQAAAIRKITLVDVVAAGGLSDARLEQLTGDVADRQLLERAITPETTSVFHLAAVVSGQAEADFDLGMRVNWEASKYLLRDVPRAWDVPARGVHELGGRLRRRAAGDRSGQPRRHTPDVVRDAKGDGRAPAQRLHTPGVRRRTGSAPSHYQRSVRTPNAAASSFASGIIREPLNGEESVCPVSAATRVWLLSPRTVTECFIKAHDIDGAAIGSNRLLNLPGMSISVGDMVAALKRVAGADVAARVRFVPEPRIEKMVATWPGELAASRARALGFPTDSDFDEIVRRYIEEAGITLPQ